jgi:molecular chaperone GrpE
MTETILMSTLRKHGLERFDPSKEEEKFNPNLHEAVFQSPVPGKTPGTVFNTQQKGFTLNGRVLRVSQVFEILIKPHKANQSRILGC